MPRGRIILRTLGTWSDKFEALGKEAGRLSEFAQALYPMLVTNADDFGRLDGGARAVKFAIWSRSPRCVEEFDQALFAMDQVGLIRRAEVEGRWVIQIENFDSPQSGLHKRTASKFPEVPGNSPLREGKGREGKRREERTGADAPTAPDDSAKKAANKAVGRFLKAFCEAWKAVHHGAVYKVKPATHVPLVKSLLATYGHDRLLQLAQGLQSVDDDWIAKTDRGIEILSSQINKLALWCAEQEAASAAHSWRETCAHEPKCERREWHMLRLAKEVV